MSNDLCMEIKRAMSESAQEVARKKHACNQLTHKVAYAGNESIIRHDAAIRCILVPFSLWNTASHSNNGISGPGETHTRNETERTNTSTGETASVGINARWQHVKYNTYSSWDTKPPGTVCVFPFNVLQFCDDARLPEQWTQRFTLTTPTAQYTIPLQQT